MQPLHEIKNNDRNNNALNDLMAISRALNQYQKIYPHLFSILERRLTRHLLNTIKKSLALSTVNLMIWVPDCLHAFFNSLNLTFQDQLLFLEKTMIKKQLEMAGSDEVRQIVFLGSGYDLQSFFASIKSPDIQFFDLDNATNQTLKIEAITSFTFDAPKTPKIIRNQINANLKYVNYNAATDSLSETLKKNGFIPEKKTLIIVDCIDGTDLEKYSQLLSEEGKLLVGSKLLPNQNWLDKFTPVAQFTPAYHLDQLGETTAVNYFRGMEVVNKRYYFLQPGDSPSNQPLEEIPINLQHYMGSSIELDSF